MHVCSIKYHWLHCIASSLNRPWGHLFAQYDFSILIFTNQNNREHADSNSDYAGLSQVSAQSGLQTYTEACQQGAPLLCTLVSSSAFIQGWNFFWHHRKTFNFKKAWLNLGLWMLSSQSLDWVLPRSGSLSYNGIGGRRIVFIAFVWWQTLPLIFVCADMCIVSTCATQLCRL